MNKNTIKKILEHPDKDELISKLILGYVPKDINEWLSAKYSQEPKLVLSVNALKSFKDYYLDVYQLIAEDIGKTKQAVATNTENDLLLAVQDNSTYNGKMLELASKEIDVRKMVAKLCIAIETRLAQVFDQIQEDPRNINTRIDRVLIEYAETFGSLLEKYYKFTESPEIQTINNNVNIQIIDQHMSVFQEVVREVLQNIDLESSFLFMEMLNERMSKLKAPSQTPLLNTDMKLAEAKILNETINQKLNNE